MCVWHEKTGVQRSRLDFLVGNVSFFSGRKTSKADTLLSLIRLYPWLDEIHIYEDSIQQLEVYQKLERQLIASSTSVYLKFHMYIVDKSKMYKIKNIDLSEEQKIELI